MLNQHLSNSIQVGKSRVDFVRGAGTTPEAVNDSRGLIKMKNSNGLEAQVPCRR